MTDHQCTKIHNVTLTQTGFDRFTVTYGKQVKRRLTYGQAACEFGACLMHQLSCEGHLDNRTAGEARGAGDSEPYFDKG